MLAGGLPMMTMPCRGFHSKLSCPAAVALLDLAAGNRETRRLTVTNSTHHSKPWLVVIAHDRRNSHQAGLSLRFYRRPRKSSKFGLPMFGHGHHRKGRLRWVVAIGIYGQCQHYVFCRSLPSIRISTAPDLNKSTDSNGAPLDRGLASSQPTGSRPISHDFQTGSTSSALGRHHHHQHHHQHHRDSRGHRKASQGASLSSSSAHDSLRSRHDSGQHTQLLPPFKERPLTEEEREIEHATLFRSLRGDYKPNEDEETHLDQHTAANDPFMPSELIEAIQTSMKNCAEYERQCAQLEVRLQSWYSA